jgi:hypothetical protein
VEACLAHVGAIGPIMTADVRDGVIMHDPWSMPSTLDVLQRNAVLFSLEGGPQVCE